MNKSAIINYQNSDFYDLLRKKRHKIQRERHSIDKILSEQVRYQAKNNPEKKYHKKHPTINALEHFSDSQCDQVLLSVPARALPNEKSRINLPRMNSQNSQYLEQTDEQRKVERAKRFIGRLKKQKEYNEGKFLLLRKKEEERKQKQQNIKQQQRHREYSLRKKSKLCNIMSNILVHQDKISYRMGEKYNLSLQKSSILQLRQKLHQLSSVIRSLNN